MRNPVKLALAALLAGVALDVAASGSSFAACSLSPVLQLPVTMVDGRPMVSAKVNGVEARFAVSSGYYFNFLSRRRAAQLGLSIFKYTEPGMHGVEGAEDEEFAAIAKTLTLPGMTVPSVPFMVQAADFSGDAVGMLGQNTFSSGDVEYDFAGGAINVYKAEGCADDPMVFWAKKAAYSVIGVERQDDSQPFILATAFVNGQPLRVMFLTDARRSVLTRDAAHKLGLDLGGADKADWTAAAIGSFKIGDEEIHNTHLLVSPHSSAYYGGYADLYLGADFFKSHHLYLSRGQRKLYFTYNGGKVFSLDTPTTASDDYGGGHAISKQRTTTTESLRHIERL